MKPYRIRLFAKSGLVIGTPQEFKFDDCLIKVFDSFAPVGGGRRHMGIFLSVRLLSSDCRSAMRQSLAAVAPLLNLLAVTQGTWIDRPRVQFCFDESIEVPDRSFGQIFYNLPTSWVRSRMFDGKLFADTWNALGPAMSGPDADSINRALHHLRLSNSAASLLDEFVELWVGLETVNGALQRRFSLSTRQSTPCSKCKAPVWGPIASGIKYALTTLIGESVDTFKRCRDMRIAILHGKGDLPNLSTGLYENIQSLRRALLSAASTLMGIPAPLNVETLVPIQDAVLMTCTIREMPLARMSESPIPHFELMAVLESVKTGAPQTEEPSGAQLRIQKVGFANDCIDISGSTWTGLYHEPKEWNRERRTEFAIAVANL